MMTTPKMMTTVKKMAMTTMIAKKTSAKKSRKTMTISTKMFTYAK